MESLQELGIQLIQTIQVLIPTLDTFMEFFTFLGRIEFYLLFITFLYWIVDPSLGFRVFMVLLSTDIVATSFKQLLHQPRPYWIGDVKHLGAEETTYGIPSAHASDSLAVWGYLAYQVKKSWMWIASIAIILLISFSRMYLGVHFPHDLIAGWLIGIIVLLLFVKFEKQVSSYLKLQSQTYQIGFGFVISILFILIGVIINFIISGTSDPENWTHYASEARSLTFYFRLAGALFGAVAGYSMMKAKAAFQVKGSWTLKLGRYLVGIIGVVIAMYGLDFLFSFIAGDESFLGYILRYIRYGMTTFWALFGAPWLFLKLRLANTS
jgi:membrane-associated phospholipid phosphatase